MNKRFMENARDRAKKLAGECKDCGGDGCYYPVGGCLCKSCAELRKIAEWEWHEKVNYCHCTCGYDGVHPDKVEYHCAISNPTFDILTIRHTLEVLGEWERFKHVITFDIRAGIDCHYEECENGWVSTNKICDILTDTELLLQAANEYMEGL